MPSPRFLMCIAIALAVCACTNAHSTTVRTAHGPATVTTNDGDNTTTVQTKEGTFTTGKGAVDLVGLAVPIYPGATASESGGYAMTGKLGKAQVVSLTSNDTFARVYAWYSAQMPAGSEKMKITSGATQMAEFALGEHSKDQRTVMIQAQQRRTSILISHNVKK